MPRNHPPTLRRWEAVVNIRPYLNGSAEKSVTYTGQAAFGNTVALHDVFLEIACRLALENQNAAHVDSLQVTVFPPETQQP